MFRTSRRKLLERIDEARVVHAIREAERVSSGQIRVSVARFFWGDVRRTAEKAFTRLGMTGTRDRNGVLFFVVPSRRRFVVLGDEALHAKVGQPFWEAVSAAISEKFRTGDFTGGLVHGIEEAGRQLATHFPSRGEQAVNELPDEIDFGKKPER